MNSVLIRAFALLTLLGASWHLFATPSLHPVDIRGQVLTAEGSPLVGATLRIADSPRGTLTQTNGQFQFIDLEAGNYDLIVSFLGYQNDTTNVTVAPDETTSLVIRLAEAPTELASVDIRADRRDPLAILQTVDLSLRPVNSAQDFLRLVPGLFTAQHAGGGKAEQIFLRGFDLDHGTDILITVDGMPVNMVSHAHGQGYADLHFLIPETVERLDVRKGPYDAADGNLATAGSVHFQTRDQLDGSLAKVEIGQYGYQRGVALVDLTGDKRAGNGYLAGEFLMNRGVFEAPQDLRRLNGFAKYGLPVGARSRLTLSASAFQSDWDASGQIPQRSVDRGDITRWGAIDPTEGGATSRYNANIALTTDLGEGATLSQRFYYSRYTFDLFSNFTFFLNDPVNGDQIRQTETRNLWGYQGNWNKGFNWKNIAMTSRLGWGFRDDQVNDLGLFRTFQRDSLLTSVADGAVQETNGFLFADHQMQLTDRLDLTLGLRYDAFAFRYEDALDEAYRPQRAQKGIVSPKLQARYQLSNNVQAYFKMGTGFHSNDARVVVAQNGREILPRAYGMEFGTMFKPVPRFLVNVGAWGLDLDQEFVYVGDEGIVEPGGKTRRVGLDVSLRYQLTDWLFADADLNWSRPRTREAPAEEIFIPLSPTFTSVGGLQVQTPWGLQGSLRYRHLSPRPANETWTLTADGYTLVDATVSYTHRNRWTYGLSMVNLMNTAWNEAQFETESQLPTETESTTEIHFTPGSPRLLRGWISWQF